MRFSTYQNWAETTDVSPRIGPYGIAYHMLKLTGEFLGEFLPLEESGFLTEDAIKELGDCWWYIARITKLADIYVSENWFSVNHNHIHSIKELCIELGKATESFGKMMRDGQTHELVDKFNNAMFSFVVGLHSYHSDNTHRIWVLNKSKLESRKERGKIHGNGDNR